MWVVDAFQLGTALLLLPAAALCEIRGLRRTCAFGIAAFGIMSLGCALSAPLPLLVLSRFLQGVSGAFVAALGSAIAGPSVAAAILSVARWPWRFLVNVPLCGLALWAFLPNAPRDEPQPRRFDRGGALPSALALGLVVIGVDTLGVHAGLAAGEIVGGLAVLALLVKHQSRRPAPLVPLDLMRIPLFSLSVVTSVCSYAAQILAYVSLPFLFQSVQHRSAVETGLLVTRWPLLVVSRCRSRGG